MYKVGQVTGPDSICGKRWPWPEGKAYFITHSRRLLKSRRYFPEHRTGAFMRRSERDKEKERERKRGRARKREKRERGRDEG